MAPSNLNQVFVVNNLTTLTGTTFNQSASAANFSKFGVWNIDATAATTANTYATVDITTLTRVQFTQSTLGNIISTPIIDTSDIVRINYNGFLNDVQTTPIQTWTPPAIPTAGKNIMIRIAVRTAPTMYEFYANPSNPNLDVVGTTGLPAAAKTFPLIGNFAAGRMIFNIEIPSTDTTSDITTSDYLKDKISKSPTLSSIFSYNVTGVATTALTARHQGVEFDLIAQYSDGSGAVGAIAATRFTPGSNYSQVISDEKSQRARYGNFNRMYFPVTQTDFAQPTYKYDMLEIVYKHDHPSSTGIARAGELNTLKVYFGGSSTAPTAVTAANFATIFGVTIATDEDQVTDISLQSNV